MKVGDVIEVHADDPETKRDIPKLVNRLGCELLDFRDNLGVYTFLILKQ